MHTRVFGSVRAHQVLPDGRWVPRTDAFFPNTLMFEWGAIVGNLLLRKGLQYGISGMYLEFENTASPGDAVTVPSYSRSGASDYYNDLQDSDDRDYLRVPIISGVLDSTDETVYPNGNRTTFFAQSSGVAGTHGKPFSDTSNSKVFGGALVAFVDEADATQDLILCRFYFPTPQQVEKVATNAVGVEWRVAWT